jgi:hypothetical protein
MKSSVITDIETWRETSHLLPNIKCNNFENIELFNVTTNEHYLPCVTKQMTKLLVYNVSDFHQPDSTGTAAVCCYYF